MSIYTIQVTVKHYKRSKKVIEVSEKMSLDMFAEKTLETFGFDLDHNFCFTTNIDYAFGSAEKMFESFRDYGAEWTEGAKSVKRNAVNKAFDKVGDKILFYFDYGANWEFPMELIDIHHTEVSKTYFQLIKSYGRDPVQYPPVD